MLERTIENEIENLKKQLEIHEEYSAKLKLSNEEQTEYDKKEYKKYIDKKMKFEGKIFEVGDVILHINYYYAYKIDYIDDKYYYVHALKRQMLNSYKSDVLLNHFICRYKIIDEEDKTYPKHPIDKEEGDYITGYNKVNIGHNYEIEHKKAKETFLFHFNPN